VERFPPGKTAGGTVSLTFRWLGTAGLEIKAGEQVLAIDPFFSRPSITSLLRPLISNDQLVAEKLPQCHFVLVTHSHYDHLMDVPTVLRQTGAAAFGSANTCQLLSLMGTPASQIRETHAGDQLSMGNFRVAVIPGQHSSIPLDRVFNGRLSPHLQPPLRVQDYRMDVCLGYHITVMGVRLLVCAAESQPVDVVFAVAQETESYYQKLLLGARPRIFVPIHWDNFTRPLNLPLSMFTRPGRLNLQQIANLAHQTLQDVTVIIPEIFREYSLLSNPDLV
jgi:L-ascorbate metabolism protein UlaG (beta-lactamase superfamily)